MIGQGQELARCIDAIKRAKAKTVGVQYPAGLKTKALDIAREIENTSGVHVILSANPTFGACDVQQMPVDMIVHLGHAPIPDLHYKNVFFYDNPLPPPENLSFLDKTLPLPGKKVGLLTTTQFRGWLPAVKTYLEGKGYEIFIGKSGGRIAYDGQLLGCDYSTAKAVMDKVDCFMFIGSGRFHPLAVAMLAPKPVIVADFEKGEARWLDEEKERAIRQRHGAITTAKDAKTFGIIVSSKRGQHRLELAKQLKNLAKKHHREAHIFVIDVVNQEDLEGYRVDAWVNTACPRIAIDDYVLFKKPMLTPPEFEIVIGERDWKDYELDEIKS